MRNLLLPAVLIASTVACQSMYYSAMEKFGVDKREILVDRVASAREDQAVAKEQIQTTYEAFQELTGFQGGDLEAMYKKLKSKYEDADEAAADVSSRITKIEDVAEALFKEWDEEIAGMADQNLARQSQEIRRDTESRYNDVVRVMHDAEGKMKPVLQTFKDHVTFIKHNLNAKAISGLKDSAMNIQSDVADLIASMQKSIDEADSFLKDMGKDASN
ncbi:MAG TPA: DUF2959 family protein [Planctomycetota bacterium]|nr:DUF2959 family protein [Planctomycetota bacterium]